MQGKSICMPFITWSPLLSRVSAPLRDAIHALVTSCNNIRMQQIQRSVWKTVSFKPLCLTAVVTGHKGGRKGNIKQGFVAKIRGHLHTVEHFHQHQKAFQEGYNLIQIPFLKNWHILQSTYPNPTDFRATSTVTGVDLVTEYSRDLARKKSHC